MSCVHEYLNEDEVRCCDLDDSPCIPEGDFGMLVYCEDYKRKGEYMGCSICNYVVSQVGLDLSNQHQLKEKLCYDIAAHHLEMVKRINDIVENIG
jgi:hypothetical protein